MDISAFLHSPLSQREFCVAESCRNTHHDTARLPPILLKHSSFLREGQGLWYVSPLLDSASYAQFLSSGNRKLVSLSPGTAKEH